jgi:hypothetical protein
VPPDLAAFVADAGLYPGPPFERPVEDRGEVGAACVDRRRDVADAVGEVAQHPREHDPDGPGGVGRHRS